MPLDAQVEELVTRIHATPHQGVLSFAGAGSQALAWLHGVGGSSRTIISAVDIYHEQSMRGLLGFRPARFTSRRVARLMAAAAHASAREVRAASRKGAGASQTSSGGEALPLFGLGSTATIATDRTKRGDHRVACAVRDGMGTVTYALTIEKGARDRVGEEELVSLVMLEAVAEACGVFGAPSSRLLPSEELRLEYHPSELVASVVAGRSDVAVLRQDGHVVSGAGLGPVALLSGSFNPVHEGHTELARIAADHVGLPALFELPLMNAAKAPIPPVEARKRALQFCGIAPVALTRTPLFAQKAALFPGSVFVVGVDTAERVVDPRFYDGDAEQMSRALDEVRLSGCRFLVAGRQSEGRYSTLADVRLPAGHEDLFEALPEADFRHDISSTEIRSGWATEWA